MNRLYKYKVSCKTPTGLGTAFYYIYSQSNIEQWFIKKNIKYQVMGKDQIIEILERADNDK